MINAKDVKIDFMYYGKKLNLIENVGGKLVCRMNDIDLIFEILEKLKDNAFDINDYQDINTSIQEEIAKLKVLPRTPQRNGKIFELEYCLNNGLIPWEFVSSNLLNKYHEIHSDTGIDFLRISNGIISEIGQVKSKIGYYLTYDDIKTFIDKGRNEQFQSIKKTLVLKSTKISKKLQAKIQSLGITIEMN